MTDLDHLSASIAGHSICSTLYPFFRGNEITLVTGVARLNELHQGHPFENR